MWAFFTSKIPYKFPTAQKVISVHKSIGGDTQIYPTRSILSNHVEVVLNDKQVLIFIDTMFFILTNDLMFNTVNF